MVKNILFGFVSLALAVASAATSYNVTFYENVVINGSQLKAGEYKLELKDNNTAVLMQGKQVATQAPVKVENDQQKFQRSAVRLDGSQVQEIRLGGTHTRLVFNESGNATK